MNFELLAEAFNLFNRANFSVPNNTFGSGIGPAASFGMPTAAFDPETDTGWIQIYLVTRDA